MLATLLVFSLLVYGLAFLVVDAKIFGCPAKSFYTDPADDEYIRDASVLPWRQALMRWTSKKVPERQQDPTGLIHTDDLAPKYNRIIKLLFTCYFCMGVWCGAAVHLSLVVLHWVDPTVPLLSSYPLLSNHILGTILCTGLAALLGGVVCYVLDLLVRVVETKIAIQELMADELELQATIKKLDVVDHDVQ